MRRAALLLALAACFPPAGDPPESTAPGEIKPDAPAFELGQLTQLELGDLPANAWTRSAPITLVNDKGERVQVITGHHTSVVVEQLLAHRAKVTCTGCRSSLTGWLQRDLLMPAGTLEGSDELALGVFLSKARQELLSGELPSGLSSEYSSEDLIELLDHGAALKNGRAFCPPWVDDGYAGIAVDLREMSSGWRFENLRELY